MSRTEARCILTINEESGADEVGLNKLSYDYLICHLLPSPAGYANAPEPSLITVSTDVTEYPLHLYSTSNCRRILRVDRTSPMCKILVSYLWGKLKDTHIKWPRVLSGRIFSVKIITAGNPLTGGVLRFRRALPCMVYAFSYGSSRQAAPQSH